MRVRLTDPHNASLYGTRQKSRLLSWADANPDLLPGTLISTLITSRKTLQRVSRESSTGNGPSCGFYASSNFDFGIIYILTMTNRMSQANR